MHTHAHMCTHIHTKRERERERERERRVWCVCVCVCLCVCVVVAGTYCTLLIAIHSPQLYQIFSPNFHHHRFSTLKIPPSLDLARVAAFVYEEDCRRSSKCLVV